MIKINIMFDHFTLLSKVLETENNHKAWGRLSLSKPALLSTDLFPSFREALKILEISTYQGFSVNEKLVVHMSKNQSLMVRPSLSVPPFVHLLHFFYIL